MLFMNFSGENFDAFKSKLHEVAENYKGKNINFLIGDLDASQGAFQVCPGGHFCLYLLLESPYYSY